MSNDSASDAMHFSNRMVSIQEWGRNPCWEPHSTRHSTFRNRLIHVRIWNYTDNNVATQLRYGAKLSVRHACVHSDPTDERPHSHAPQVMSVPVCNDSPPWQALLSSSRNLCAIGESCTGTIEVYFQGCISHPTPCERKLLDINERLTCHGKIVSHRWFSWQNGTASYLFSCRKQGLPFSNQ